MASLEGEGRNSGGDPVEDAMTIQAEGRRTKHAELTETLLELVSSLTPGERLPSQTELMQQYQVSDRTVLRSLEDLRRDGWIVRRRGSGTFVADPRERAERRGTRKPEESRTVAALALTPSPSPFYQCCLELLAQVVERSGWSLVCHHARHEPGNGDVLPLEALRPRGFVAFNFALYPIARRLQARGHRTVVLGPPPVDVYPDVPCVFGDHEYGGYLASRHLVDLGHRRLAYVRRSDMSRARLERSFRWKGHLRALADAAHLGIALECVQIDAETLSSWRSDPALARAYFHRADAPTALVAWNDAEAISLLTLLQHAGLRVPDDVSVVGYDALPEGEHSLPPLTTVDQHLDCQLRAVMDLLSRETPPPQTQAVIVVPELVVRSSCGPPPT
jgi:GntR family transcriptional regulator, arabinose operon transcriptional repressor